jgi:hypothetical protein
MSKAMLTDAQFETIASVLARHGGSALRFADTKTVMTLTALNRKGMATIVWGVVDGRRGIHSAEITGYGRTIHRDETTRRAAVAKRDASLAGEATRRAIDVQLGLAPASCGYAYSA